VSKITITSKVNNQKGGHLKIHLCSKWIFLFAATFLVTVSASADSLFTSTLNTQNDGLAGYTAPFGTVTVDLTSSTTATITFTSSTVGSNIYLFGDGGSVDVNINATSWTLGAISGSNSGTGFTPGPYTDGGSGQVDGFGTFNQTINGFDGFTHSADTVLFSVTNTSGTWADASSVLVANSGGYDAAAHIFVTSSPANRDNGAVVTGYAAESAVTAVPEPAPSMLLAGSLAVMSLLIRKKLGGGNVSIR
jgi:hypothetical protein